jgi:cytoskeleton protein RodZ
MKKTGEFLRKAREEKGLSIHEIGLSLKINPKILKQIEEGDKDNLPAKTFLRGFVQSYALFLKVDPNEVLKTFSEEMGTTKPNQISLTSGPQIRGNSIDIEDPENKDDLGIKRHTGHNFNKEKFEFKNIGIGIVVFVLLLSLIAVRKVVEKYQKEAEVDVAKTEENLKIANKLELPQAPPPVTLPQTTDVKPAAAEVSPPVVGQPQVGTAQPTAPQPSAATTTTAPTTSALNQPTTLPAQTNGTVKPTATAPVVTPNAVNTNPTDPTGPNTASPTQHPGLPVNKPATTTNTATQLPKPTVTAPVPTNTNKPVVTPTPTTATTATTTAPATTAAVGTTPATQKPVPPVVQKPADTTVGATTTPPKEEPKKPKNIELVIEAFETVEIEMVQATGKIERIKMSPSQVQTIKTVSGVKLNISNGGAVNLMVNGKDMGVPGDLGKPKRVSF